jgi:hypothetical protein
MPFNLIAKPQRIHPAYNPMQVWVRDTDSAEPGFNFIFDYFVKAPFSTVFELANRFKTTRNPNHPTQGIYSTFVDLAKHSQNYLSHNIDFGLANWRFADDKQIIQYKVECRTLTPTNFIFGPFVFDNNPFTNISIAGHSFNVGDSVFIESNASVLNGYFTVIGVVGPLIEIDINFDDINAPEPVVGNKSVFGKVYYSDKRATLSTIKQTVTGYTHNQAVSFQSYPTYDSERFTLDPNPADPDFQRILTNVPRFNFTIKPYQNLYWNFLHNRGEGVNCIFFENDGGDLFKMDAKSFNNGDYMIKQVNVSPDANFVPALSGTTFPLVKPNTKYYDVWAESSCCVGYCETLDITLIIEGVPTLITATQTGDLYNGKPVYEYVFEEVQVLIRYSLDVINSWEMLVTQPEEIVFAILKDCSCFIFSACKTVPCGRLTLSIDIGGFNNVAWIIDYSPGVTTNGRFTYLSTQYTNLPVPQMVNAVTPLWRITWSALNTRWELELLNPIENTHPTILAWTGDEECPTEFTINNECEIYLTVNIDGGNIALFQRNNLTGYYEADLFFGTGDPRNGVWEIFFDNTSNRWSFGKNGTEYFYEELSGIDECPVRNTWIINEDTLNNPFDNISTYDIFDSLTNTPTDLSQCESFELLGEDFGYGENSYQFVFEDNIYLVYYSSDDNKWYLRNDSLDIIIYEAPCTSNEYVLDYVGENYFNEFEICDPSCPPNLTEFQPYLQCDSFILNITLGGTVQVPVVRVGNTLQYPIFEGILDNFKYTLYYDMPNDRWVIRKESLTFSYDEIIFENYDFSECPITIDNDNWVPTAELCYNCINDGIKITIVFEGETYEYCVPVVGEYNDEPLYELNVPGEFFIRIRYQDAVPGIGGQPGWYMLVENYVDLQADNGYYIIGEPDCPFTNEWLIDEEFWTPDVNIVTSSCVECSASVTQYQDVITLFNSEFPCEIECPEGEWNYLPPVDVQILSQSTCDGQQSRTSEKIRVNIQNCAGDKNNIQILFQDRAGSWSSFAFPLNVNQKVDNEKKSYRKPIGDVNLTKGYNYDTYENERPTYQVDTLKSFTLRTDWLNDEMNLYFEELLSSPVMYINFGDYKKENLIEPTPEYWYACEITNPSQETIRLKNKRMFNRTIEVKLSSNDSINI